MRYPECDMPSAPATLYVEGQISHEIQSRLRQKLSKDAQTTQPSENTGPTQPVVDLIGQVFESYIFEKSWGKNMALATTGEVAGSIVYRYRPGFCRNFLSSLGISPFSDYYPVLPQLPPNAPIVWLALRPVIDDNLAYGYERILPSFGLEPICEGYMAFLVQALRVLEIPCNETKFMVNTKTWGQVGGKFLRTRTSNWY